MCHFPLSIGAAASKTCSLTQHPAIPAQHLGETTALRATVRTDLTPLQYLTNGNQPCLDGTSNLKGKHLSRKKKKELNKERAPPDPVCAAFTPETER